MGYIEVHGAELEDGRIARMAIKISRLPARVVDRQTALTWMGDGHSLIPRIDGELLPSLQIVEVGGERFIRHDNAAEPQDALPELPPVREAS